jgi:hypothetical protein
MVIVFETEESGRDIFMSYTVQTQLHCFKLCLLKTQPVLIQSVQNEMQQLENAACLLADYKSSSLCWPLWSRHKCA